jgi:hypothetical protein
MDLLVSQTLLNVPTFDYVNSADTTSVTAAVDTYYVVDTASTAVTITFPAGVAIGHWIIVQNAPAGGLQLGGTNPGHDVTVVAGDGETFEGDSSVTVSPPTSRTTAACRQYFPVGPESADQSGFGAGWAHV